MPDRHGFPENRHGFWTRVVVFTSETEIRVLHYSSSRTPGKCRAVFRFRSIPENRVTCPEFLRTGRVFSKTGMVSLSGDESATGGEGREWV